MNVHEFEDLGANLVELLKFNLTKHLDVLVTPVKLSLIVHGLGFSKLSLHGADDILGDLAHVCSGLKIRLRVLAPLSNEGVQVSLSIDIR